MKLLNWLMSRWLMHPRWPMLWVILGLFLMTPSLFSGFRMDDHPHRLSFQGIEMLGRSKSHPVMGMFYFVDGKLKTTRRNMEFGNYPWWTHEKIRITFWRPLSAMTHWLDHRAWPESPFLMYLHSLLWLGFLFGLGCLLYLEFFGRTWLAALAGLLFVVSDFFSIPVSWLANRNSIIAMSFGLATLILHHRWRDKGQRWAGLLAPFALLLGLLGAEMAVATCGYLFGYMVCLDRASWRRRLASLLPYAVTVLAWRAVYSTLGYGTFGSGFYIDPIREPFGFFLQIIKRFPLLWMGLWGSPPPDFVTFLPPFLKNGFMVWAVLWLVLVLVLLYPLRKERLAGFWALGMFFSLLPVCATSPNGRLLVYPSVGAMGLLAMWIGGVRDGASWLPDSALYQKWARFFVSLFLGIHLLASLVTAPLKTQLIGVAERAGQKTEETVPVKKGHEDETVILLNCPFLLSSMFLPVRKRLLGKPVPRRVRALGPAHLPIKLQRTDAFTLVLTPRAGFMFGFDSLFRNPSTHPFKVGEVVRFSDLTIRVLKVRADGRPQQVRFRFSLPLDSPKLHFFQAQNEGYRPFVMPKIGQTVVLPPALPF